MFATAPAAGIESIRAELEGLGIRRVTAIGRATPLEANLSFGWSNGGSVGERNLRLAIELEAAKDDNIAKVRPSGHLFVWIDSTMSAANAVFSFEALPEIALDVPSEVDCVWTAPGPYEDTSSHLAKPVWRWTRDVGWEDLGVVSSARPGRASMAWAVSNNSSPPGTSWLPIAGQNRKSEGRRIGAQLELPAGDSAPRALRPGNHFGPKP